VARWNGSNWSPLGSGMSNSDVYALASYGGHLYAAGYFDLAGGVSGTAKLARWNGSQWQAIDAQLELWSNQLWDLATFDDGNGEALYIAGNFADIGGVTGANFIARWDGSSYSALGAPIAGNVPLIIFSAHVWDDGNGPALYVGGRFTSIDGVPASRIAKWNGSNWSSLGAGVTGAGVAPSIMDMVAFDDGNGEALYVGGQAFTFAGGQPANRIARWNGSEWSAVGDGFADGIVWNLEVFDDGSGGGPALYAFGTFTMSGSTPLGRVARWNGASWEPLGSGTNGSVYAARVFDDGSGKALYIGASMSSVDGVASNNIARYYGCEPAGGVPGDLNGDGVVDVFDLLILLGAWGMCPPAEPGGNGTCPADLDGSGAVDVFDLLILLGNWG
jgi:trimeric autotransporter adhesin